jgi:hypothetical protein
MRLNSTARRLKALGQILIRQLVRHSYALLALSVIDFLVGGIILWTTEFARLSLVRAYYEHFFTFFGGQLPESSTALSKVYSLVDATMGILVVPSVIGALIDREAAGLAAEDKLEYQLRILGEKNGLDPKQARKLAKETLAELKKERQKITAK